MITKWCVWERTEKSVTGEREWRSRNLSSNERKIKAGVEPGIDAAAIR
jgi:hypothetical protein